EMEAIGVFAVVAFGVFDVFLMTIMKMTMFGFYEQRINDALARRAELSPSDVNEASVDHQGALAGGEHQKALDSREALADSLLEAAHGDGEPPASSDS
ncbi:MAG: hypothetical protein VX519_01000, partial [Myxococcota bacterium]|nr:hypothetical protein [Myxococcota bacterium]